MHSKYRPGETEAKWQAIWERQGAQRVASDEQGLFVSPFAEPNWLDTFRGLYLRCPEAAVRARVKALVEARPREKPEGDDAAGA